MWFEGAVVLPSLASTLQSSHSLQTGLATVACDTGPALPDLMRPTQHRNTQVAQAYPQPADVWRDSVIRKLLTARPQDESKSFSRQEKFLELNFTVANAVAIATCPPKAAGLALEMGKHQARSDP